MIVFHIFPDGNVCSCSSSHLWIFSPSSCILILNFPDEKLPCATFYFYFLQKNVKTWQRMRIVERGGLSFLCLCVCKMPWSSCCSFLFVSVGSTTQAAAVFGEILKNLNNKVAPAVFIWLYTAWKKTHASLNWPQKDKNCIYLVAVFTVVPYFMVEWSWLSLFTLRNPLSSSNIYWYSVREVINTLQGPIAADATAVKHLYSLTGSR